MLTRRQFNLRSLRLAITAPLADLLAVRAKPTPPEINNPEMGFPSGDYTPFGYLNNPYHCWALNRSGVLRSAYGIGFGWHYPAGPGGYFDEKTNGVYSAFLRLGFSIRDRRWWEPEDFRDAELRCPYHSTNLIVHKLNLAGTELSCTFVQVGENALAVRIEPTRRANVPVLVMVAHEYRLGNAKWWGGNGIVGRYRPDADCLVTRSFAAGTVFAIGATIKSKTRFFGSGAQPIADWFDAKTQSNQGIAYAHEPLQGALTYELGAQNVLDGIMARAANESAALKELRRSQQSISAEIAKKQREDYDFWKQVPRLEGDWPQHWKNGWIYDFETLRTMVRRPIGAYKHRWDAMQIQAPRNVLAETSIDMWALSHADPETAKDVFLGQFLDAVEPNTPCMREDAVMNMVAADGSECGTSISWCYPFFCAASIQARCGDLRWLARLYPRLARLLRWTIANRSDADGFIVGKCSWETGMDGARRFLIDQPTGAEQIEFIRIVELQAAAAHAAGVLESFARELGDQRSEAEWNNLRKTYTAKTQQLWNGNDWFHDFDTRSQTPITTVGKDIGQVAPIFCGVANAEQTREMVPSLHSFYEQSRAGSLKNADGWVDGLQWSSLTLPYLESLWTAGEYELLSQVVHMIAERIYPSMDRREVKRVEGTWVIQREGESHIGIPGVSCEMWTPEGAAGGEGYGWGAVLPVHIMRNVIGIRESDRPRRLWLCPNLPAELMVTNRKYSLQSWRYRELTLNLEYRVLDEQRIDISIRCTAPRVEIAVKDAGGNLISRDASSGIVTFTGDNHQRYELTL